MLVDHRDDDWNNLWWVRADLTFAEHAEPTAEEWKGFADKYVAYGHGDSIRSVLRFTVERHRGWSATDSDQK